MKNIAFIFLFFSHLYSKINEIRDPFSIGLDSQNEVFINSIVKGQDNVTALVEYNKKQTVVNVGDSIEDEWKVIFIDEKGIVIENLKSQKRKMVLIDE